MKTPFSYIAHLFIFTALISSCSEKSPEETQDTHYKTYLSGKITDPEEHEINWKVIGSDEVVKPEKIKAGPMQKRDISSYKTNLTPPRKLTRGQEYLKTSLHKDSLKIRKKTKIQHRKLKVQDSPPITSEGFKYKDRSNGNIKYIDVSEGLASSYIWSTYMDSRNNLWIATEGGGVTMFSGNDFQNYTIENGITNNSIRSILESENGDLWFGTYGGGLLRYTGNNVYYYDIDDGLISNYIWDIIEDQSGALWIGTENGLCKIENDELINFDIHGINENLFIRSLFIDSENNMWIGTLGDGLIELKPNSINHYNILSDQGALGVYDIQEDSNGKIWFSTEEESVLMIDENELFQFKTDPILSKYPVRSIEIDNKGLLWFGSYGSGAIKLEDNILHIFDETSGLSNNFIRDVHVDWAGNVWISTDGAGISLFSTLSLTNIKEEDGMASDYPRGFVQDSLGNIWMGNFQGISKYSKGEFSYFPKGRELKTEHINGISMDSFGHIWFSCFYYGAIKFDGEYFYYYSEENGLSGKTTRTIYEDSHKNMWFGTNDNGLTKFDGKNYYHLTQENGLTGKVVWDFVEDKAGIIWAATDKGLLKIQGNTFQIFTEENGLSSNHLRSVHIDQSGFLWLGSYDKGVMMISDENIYYFNITTGLTNNMIDLIGEDQLGNIWIGTERGLNIFQEIEENDGDLIYKSRQIGINQGLHSLDFYFNSFFSDKDGNLWMGGGKSLVYIDQEALQVPNHVHTVTLKNIFLNDEFVDFKYGLEDPSSNPIFKKIHYKKVHRYLNYPKYFRANHEIKTIKFDFFDQAWITNDNTTFQYRLIGFDEEWGKETSSSTVTYNLSPGDYTLQARARERGGEFGPLFELSFSISPPWWQSITAKISYFFLFLILSYVYTKVKTKNVVKSNINLEQKVDLRTRELSVQNSELEKLNIEKDEMMNIVAHDLRSPLHKISGFLQLIEMDGELNESQKEYIKYCREIIYENVGMIQNLLDAFSSDQKESSFHKADINLKVFMREWLKGYDQVLFKKLQKVHFNIDSEALLIYTDKPTLKRILDNLMSNAIKFSKRKTNIYINVGKNQENIIFSIRDQGPGISDEEQSRLFKKFEKLSNKPTMGEKSTGLGLSIVKTLVEKLGGTVQVDSALGSGTEFVVILPEKE